MFTETVTPAAWFGVRSLYEHAFTDEDGLSIYEERIVVFCALNEDEAIALAEAEAVQYATANTCTYLEYLNCYSIAAVFGNAVEVFSLMRSSALDDKEYIDRYFDTGSERTR